MSFFSEKIMFASVRWLWLPAIPDEHNPIRARDDS